MIQVDHIHHYYGKEKVLSDINLTLDEGSFTILTGESGSGKTTLLSIISTLLTPTQGKVSFTTEIGNIDRFRNEQIGFIFQFHYLIAHLTVFENIKMVTRKSNPEITALLKRLGINTLARKYPFEISGGQRQRIAIARAMINRPAYIFADEPTGNLDSENSQMIFKILREIDATVLVVTHDRSLIEPTDRIIMMKDGHIVC